MPIDQKARNNAGFALFQGQTKQESPYEIRETTTGTKPASLACEVRRAYERF
jgi:hypothetical protein